MNVADASQSSIDPLPFCFSSFFFDLTENLAETIPSAFGCSRRILRYREFSTISPNSKRGIRNSGGNLSARFSVRLHKGRCVFNHKLFKSVLNHQTAFCNRRLIGVKWKSLSSSAKGIHHPLQHNHCCVHLRTSSTLHWGLGFRDLGFRG